MELERTRVHTLRALDRKKTKPKHRIKKKKKKWSSRSSRQDTFTNSLESPSTYTALLVTLLNLLKFFYILYIPKLLLL